MVHLEGGTELNDDIHPGFSLEMITPMTSQFNIHNNEVNQRFEMELNPEVAFLEYRWYKDNLALMHTFVPDGHEGKGVAGALAKHGLEFARQRAVRVLVYCPYVSAFIKRHPEYGSLVIQSEGAG